MTMFLLAGTAQKVNIQLAIQYFLRSFAFVLFSFFLFITRLFCPRITVNSFAIFLSQ